MKHRKVAEENQQRPRAREVEQALERLETKQEEKKKVVAARKQVLDEAQVAAMSGGVHAAAALSMTLADIQLVGLQVLAVIELRRIAGALEQKKGRD